MPVLGVFTYLFIFATDR